MSARIYLHPTCTLQEVHRLYREHRLVAVSKPVIAAKRNHRVELEPLRPAPWHAPAQRSAP
jgi:hypothetical protein